MKITKATAQGRRSYQEDRFIVVNKSYGLLVGVFDGHGGDSVSEIAEEEFPILFDENRYTSASPTEALFKTFDQLNSLTKNKVSGSTASVVFMPSQGDEAYVAVLGDSPVVIKQADGSIWTGPDHNVRSNIEEAQAARERGGIISGGYLMETYHGSGLQMARALGDASLSKVLDRTPEISVQSLGAGSFVLVATDGAFDPGHKNTNDAIASVVSLIEADFGAQDIVDRALAIPTLDNVTAILVRL